MRTRMLAAAGVVLCLSACSNTPAPPPPGPTSASGQLKENLHQVFSAPGGTVTFEMHVRGRQVYSTRTTYDFKRHAQIARARFGAPGGRHVKVLIKRVGGRQYFQLPRGRLHGCWVGDALAKAQGIKTPPVNLMSPVDVLHTMKAVGYLQNEVRATVSTQALTALAPSLAASAEPAPKSSRTPVLVDLYDDRIVYQVDGADLAHALVKAGQLKPRQAKGGRTLKLVVIVVPASPLTAKIVPPDRTLILGPDDFAPGLGALKPGACPAR